ncbi:MAG: hypothetical protein MI784_11540 [Cytophagales bacterium]|nr:hypothetical protein [Cytophagales bacterium]
MNGFNGPFQLIVREQKSVGWSALSDEQKQNLEADGYGEDKTKVYQITVSAVPDSHINEKGNEWEKIRRVYFELSLGKKCKSKIVDVSPRVDPKVMPPHVGHFASHKKKFFNLVQYVFRVEPVILPEIEGYKVLTTFNNRYGQWIFTDVWDKPDFTLTICLDKEPEGQWLYLSTRPVIKGSKSLKNICLWKHAITFEKELV